MMRRYWIPALTSADVVSDGAPSQVTLFGERLVVFRDSNGNVGILDEYCPHRGASLVLARNENCTLQCLYHGWKVDVRGQIVDTPTEPEDSTFKHRIRHVAYPCREAGGLIWVYMGPADDEPPFSDFGWTHMPDEATVIVRAREECNFVQCLEGVIDSAHSNFLHSSFIVPDETKSHADGVSDSKDDGSIGRPSNDTRPKIEVENTVYGFRYAAVRKPLLDADKFKYVRTTLFVAPFFAFFPAPPGWIYMQAFVPVDDTHTMFYYIQTRTDGAPIEDAERAEIFARAGLRPGVDIDADLRKVKNRSNLWGQDRDAMRAGNFSGITGVNLEDIAVQESMGPIFDRTREHLGQTDAAIIRMRRLLLQSIEEFRNGTPPIGLRDTVPYQRLRAEDRIVPLDSPWQAVGAFADEYVAI